MKNIIYPVATVGLLALSACHTPVPVSHQGPAQLDADVKTYAVVQHAVGTSLSTNDLFEQRIHDVMAEKGYAPAPRHQADVLVSFKALAPSAGELRDGSSESASLMRSMAGMTADGEDVPKVVLVMLEDARTDRVVWVGWSTNEVPRHEFVPKTRESLDRILSRLPARGG